jgi:hypothetical protein
MVFALIDHPQRPILTPFTIKSPLFEFSQPVPVQRSVFPVELPTGRRLASAPVVAKFVLI